MSLEEVIVNGVLLKKGEMYSVRRGKEEVYRGYFLGKRKKDGLLYFGKREEEWDTAFNPKYFRFFKVEEEY